MSTAERSPGYAWYVAGVLATLSLISFLDRQLLALLVGPLKRSLAIDDTQMALLNGVAFALLYGFAALPAGRWADRGSRRTIMLIGLVVWSVMTAACGFATNFEQFFLARMGVGIGEAFLGPAAVSLLSDYFSPDRRGRALSIYQMGAYVGGGGSLLAAGFLLHLVNDSDLVTVPFLGDVPSWKIVFVVMGIVGIVFAPVLLTVREPARGRAADGSRLDPALRTGFLSLLRRNRAIVACYACFALNALNGFAVNAWAATLFIREYHAAASSIGFSLGGVTVLAGLTGALCSGIAADRFTRLTTGGRKLDVAIVGFCITLASLFALATLNDFTVTLIVVGILNFANALTVSSSPATLTDVLPRRFRGTGAAVYYLNVAVFGMSIGPVAVALANVHVFAGTDLRAAIWAVVGVVAIIGLLLALWARRPYGVLAAQLQDDPGEPASP